MAKWQPCIKWTIMIGKNWNITIQCLLLLNVENIFALSFFKVRKEPAIKMILFNSIIIIMIIIFNGSTYYSSWSIYFCFCCCCCCCCWRKIILFVPTAPYFHPNLSFNQVCIVLPELKKCITFIKEDFAIKKSINLMLQL